MKWLLIPLFAIAAAAQGMGPGPDCGHSHAPTISLVQHTAVTPDSSAGAFGSATTTGNTLIACMEYQNSTGGPTLSAISNTGGATWTRAVQGPLTTTGEDARVECWLGTGNTGQATDTVSATITSYSYFEMYLSEWHGVAGSPLDTTASTNGTAATTASTGSFSMTAGDLEIGIFLFGAGGATAGAGFTALDTDTFSMVEYKLSSPSSDTVTGTGTSSVWTIAAATFK